MAYNVVPTDNADYIDYLDPAYMSHFDLWLDTLNLIQQTLVYEAMEKLKYRE